MGLRASKRSAMPLSRKSAPSRAITLTPGLPSMTRMISISLPRTIAALTFLIAGTLSAQDTVRFEPKIAQPTFAVREPVLRIKPKTVLISRTNFGPMDAFRLAHVELIEWLADDYGFGKLDAYALLGQVGESSIANVVDPLYSVVAKFPKRFLPK